VPMDPREAEELRNLVRRELEARERLHSQRRGDLRARHEAGGLSAERRRIIEEEVEAFYRGKGYRRYESEEGEVEWLSEDELLERERQLPVDMEELSVEQRRVRNRFVFILLLIFCAVVLLFLLVRERTGSLQVLCNVQGSTVHLNGSATDFATDCRIDHLTTGPLLVSVAKYGYVPDGPAGVRVNIRGRDTEVVILRLKPQTLDSLGRPK
jgi:hypothetical protein